MRATAELSPGTLVGDRYLVQRTLGYGSCGCTYLVFDNQNSAQLRVLKEFAPADNRESVIQKCYSLFEQEAQVLCKLQHPQIPQCFGFFEDRGRLFLVQEYIDGKTYCELLQERLALGKVFSEVEVLQWLKDLLPVLENIHSRHIIHRDISPDNIMFPNQGNKPVLIDFGVVKQVITQIGSQIGSEETAASVRGTMVGKAGYSPPEQLRLGQCYPNSDLYSLAVTALVLLTGRHPSELCDGYSLKWQWRKFVKLHPSLGLILDKMLAEIPKDRFQSASEVLIALSTILPQRSSLSSMPPRLAQPPSYYRNEGEQTEFGSEDDTLIAHSYLKPPSSTAKRSFPSQQRTVIQEPGTSLQIDRGTSVQAKAKSKLPSQHQRRKRTSQPIGRRQSVVSSVRWLTAGVLVAGSLIGGWAIGERSSKIAFVCEVFNNCASDRPLPKTAKGDAQAQKKVAEASSFEGKKELQEISDRLGGTKDSSLGASEVPSTTPESTSQSQEEFANYQKELTEKVRRLQSQISELVSRRGGEQTESSVNAKTEQKVERQTKAPEENSEKKATQSEETASPQSRQAEPLENPLLERSDSIPLKDEPTPAARETPAPKQPPADAAANSNANESQPKPQAQINLSAAQKNEVILSETQPLAASENPTPAPKKTNPPAETFKPGYWQPAARIDPQRPFQVKLINQTGEQIEYALTTNEFSPRQLASRESATLTYVPLDANLLINPIASPSNSEFASSLKFDVAASNNLLTVTILPGDRARAGDSTVNVHRTGAIYIF
ncbi:serine/threonine protein kinase [Pleurocapsa sp. PCC 7327]|uniref:protein kinase domain-containing protein n=1 Tax=Pleurocapsa sp. PCC 7327 TaxID=118163 RepID=UPI00029FD00F|nr:protein kinase [Pleurocapsa sp. PCC 7327]AFY75579.1 serine/threonine protein kinase [Pleurocapsa sp. PCC 7327]